MVIVIGAGATGSGILRDLSMRGIPALLLEQGSICNGTSARFHGLLHSGCRYAANDTEAAEECIRENTILRRIGKQCVTETEGYFVLTEQDDPAYLDKWREGCRLAGIPVKEISVQQALAQEPGLSPRLRRVFEVPDATIDGFRLVLHNIQSAQRYGGKILTQHEVIGIRCENGRVVGVDVLDKEAKEKKFFPCDILINATGSWCGKIAALAGLSVPVTPDRGMLLIFNHRLCSHVINRLHKSSDGDIFVPHGSITILGTTSVSVEDPADSRLSTQEALHLLEIGKVLFPSLPSQRILRAFAGTRPLYTAQGVQGRSASRGFHISDHAEEGLDGFFTIFGGKFTTFRFMAEKICDRVAARLGVTAPCRTADESIVEPPSEECKKKAAKVFLPQSIDLLADRLGESFARCVEEASPQNPLLCECEMVSLAELNFIAHDSLTHSLQDIRIRTRLGMGTCQGTFCALRTFSALVEAGLPASAADPIRFLQERWKGERSVYWGQLARETEMRRMLCSGVMGLDQETRAYTVPQMPQARLKKALIPKSRLAHRADCIVVGAGLAGLTAATVAARQGKKVLMLSAGVGSLHIGSATIDLLGRDCELPARHPYTLLGKEKIREALDFFVRLTEKHGWPFTGYEKRPVFTSLGTTKYSYLVPYSLDAKRIEAAKRILVCGVTGVRDCMPAVLAKALGGDESWLSSPEKAGYRVQTALDIARLLDTEKGLASFCRELEKASSGYDAVIVPPIMGTQPSTAIPLALEAAAGCPVLEMAGIPPGVTGMRLASMFMDELRELGVTCIENAKVSASEGEGKRLRSLFTQHRDGVRRYEAEEFILATGGIVSGGLDIHPGFAEEKVLGLHFPLPVETSQWTEANLFSPQPFALLGYSITEKLEVSLDGKEPLYENVRCAGRSIGNFDPVFERSGNGVALVTGYHAAL